MIVGYLKPRENCETVLRADHHATATRKDDDHSRKKKGDFVVLDKSFEFRVEVQSVMTLPRTTERLRPLRYFIPKLALFLHLTA